MGLFKGRMRWDSRLVFILAAVGSAIGLGNVWRFPYLTYEFGGGAFLIPYLIALFVLGIPLLILEFGLGQKFQKGAIGSFKAIDKRLGSIGFIAVAAGFIVITYYAVVMAWSLVYLLGSFQDPLPWSSGSSEFFFGNVLQITDSVGDFGSVSVGLIIALLVVWVSIFFCVFKGVRSVGKVVLITMPLPALLLLILLVRALTLEGAMQGISFYVTPDFNALLDPEVWLAAATQIFFTLSVAFGIMIAYASYNKKHQSITKSAFIVALINSGFSLIAGFVVFGVLGHMAAVQNVPIDEVVKSGPSLAFVVFPEAISLLPLASFFSVLFFLMLFTLGIDSAFSLVEAVNTVVSDKFRKMAAHVVAFIVCVAGFVAGLIFAAGSGLYFLDIVDHFVTNYSLAIVGIMSCIAVGWMYGADNMREFINSVSEMKLGVWWNHAIRWVIPLSLGTLFLIQLYRDIITPYEGYPAWALSVGWLTVLIPLAIGIGMVVKAKN